MAVLYVILASLAVFVGQVVGVMIAEFIIYEEDRRRSPHDIYVGMPPGFDSWVDLEEARLAARKEVSDDSKTTE